LHFVYTVLDPVYERVHIDTDMFREFHFGSLDLIIFKCEMFVVHIIKCAFIWHFRLNKLVLMLTCWRL